MAASLSKGTEPSMESNGAILSGLSQGPTIPARAAAERNTKSAVGGNPNVRILQSSPAKADLSRCRKPDQIQQSSRDKSNLEPTQSCGLHQSSEKNDDWRCEFRASIAIKKKESYKPRPMTEGKRNIIQELLQECNIESAERPAGQHHQRNDGS